MRTSAGNSIRAHGTRQRYDTDKCRCDECREANKLYQRKKRARLGSIPKDPDDPRHGTSSFYRNNSCRCDACSAAHSEAVKREYRSRLASGAKDDPTDTRHGTYSFYAAWGCRCERCAKVAKEYEAARYEAERRQRTAS